MCVWEEQSGVNVLAIVCLEGTNLSECFCACHLQGVEGQLEHLDACVTCHEAVREGTETRDRYKGEGKRYEEHIDEG
jgi:hypothetical protein